MKVTRKSVVSGLEHTVEMDITPQQLRLVESRAMLIQDAVPHLSPSEREFLMTGITEDEWDATFGGMMDEDADDSDGSTDNDPAF